MSRLLNRLASLGDVEKITIPGMRAYYWRRWPEQQDPALAEMEAGQ
jgi:hypothetical protein